MHAVFGSRPLAYPCSDLGELRISSPESDMAALARVLHEDGYLLLRGLLPREDVLAGREAILSYMAAKEALTPGTPLLEGVMPRVGKRVQLINNQDVVTLPAVSGVLEHPHLFRFFERLFRSDVATFAYKWLRAVGNEQYTGAHMDFVYMGRGSDRLHTVWLPFGDIEVEQGTLCVCEGSNHLDSFAHLRQTYGRSDVDRDRTDGWFTKEPMDITEQFGGRWLTADFLAGDVILFGMHTMHASTTNLTNRYRLSCDVRYQPARDPMDERWRRNGIGHSGYQGEDGPLRTMDELRKEWGL